MSESVTSLLDSQSQNDSSKSSEVLLSNLSESQRVVGSTGQDADPETNLRPRIVSVTQGASNLAEMLTSKADVRESFLRTEQYANWSERFGQVLGQRLSVALNNGAWNVKLNLHPSSLGHIDINLDIGERGIEGQINSTDPAARQLLQDSLSKLRATLSELYDQEASINLSMGDKEKSGSGSEKPDNSVEVSIDLLAEEFALDDDQVISLKGLDLFV